jgi:hypothetical protein
MSARADLCGGRPAMVVPTATVSYGRVAPHLPLSSVNAVIVKPAFPKEEALR